MYEGYVTHPYHLTPTLVTIVRSLKYLWCYQDWDGVSTIFIYTRLRQDHNIDNKLYDHNTF